MSDRSKMQDAFPNLGQEDVLAYLRSGAKTSPGLAIKAADSADALSGAFSYGLDGKVYAKAAVATLSLADLGTVAAGATKTAFLAIDASGTVTLVAVSPGSDGATRVPEPADGTCLFGAVTVANGSASAFTAGTTALDAADITVTYRGLSGMLPGEAL